MARVTPAKSANGSQTFGSVRQFHNKIAKIIKIIVIRSVHSASGIKQRTLFRNTSLGYILAEDRRSIFWQRILAGFLPCTLARPALWPDTLLIRFPRDTQISLFGRLHLLFVLALFTNCTIRIKKRISLASGQPTLSCRRLLGHWVTAPD